MAHLAFGANGFGCGETEKWAQEENMKVIPPGSTIGILGGGQLGRMTAMAAARLGYRCHIFCPEPDSPAFDVAAAQTVAPYEDEAALARFASEIAVATLEFENVPAASLHRLATLV